MNQFYSHITSNVHVMMIHSDMMLNKMNKETTIELVYLNKFIFLFFVTHFSWGQWHCHDQTQFENNQSKQDKMSNIRQENSNKIQQQLERREEWIWFDEIWVEKRGQSKTNEIQQRQIHLLKRTRKKEKKVLFKTRFNLQDENCVHWSFE